MSIQDKAVIDSKGHGNFSATPSDGVHIFHVDDGTRLLEGSYNTSLLMRFTVDDKNDADDGRGFTWFLPVTGEGERGQAAIVNAEKYLCTLLVELGIGVQIDNALGDVNTYFEPETLGKLVEIINAVGTDKFINLKIRTTAAGKTYISECWPVGTSEPGDTQKVQTDGSKKSAMTFG